MSQTESSCPHCGAILRYTAKMIGREIACPGCRERVLIAASQPPPPPDSDDDAPTEREMLCELVATVGDLKDRLSAISRDTRSIRISADIVACILIIAAICAILGGFLIVAH